MVQEEQNKGAWSALSVPVRVGVLVLAALLAVVLVKVLVGARAPAPKNSLEGNDVFKTVVETEPISFDSIEKKDPARPEGETEKAREGIVGIAKATYKVYAGGRKIEVGRKVIKEPVSELVIVGSKPRPILNLSWDELTVGLFDKAPGPERVAVADRFLNEKGLKGKSGPWQDPNWLVAEMEKWVKTQDDAQSKRLEWELGYRVNDWKHEQFLAKLKTLKAGSTIEEAKALLGDPDNTRFTESDGSRVDYLYYGPVGDREELVFSGGQYQGRNHL